ncbi:hypothetical protein AB0N06_23320 [Streptomyces sp. NPDC051020]|uniref:hypothetical protein n=1 Tax=Streptomyces sp. NPDC051020 TaxID=3155409 RepID=UPI00343C3419
MRRLLTVLAAGVPLAAAVYLPTASAEPQTSAASRRLTTPTPTWRDDVELAA